MLAAEQSGAHEGPATRTTAILLQSSNEDGSRHAQHHGYQGGSMHAQHHKPGVAYPVTRSHRAVSRGTIYGGECHILTVLHVSTFATTGVALPTRVEP